MLNDEKVNLLSDPFISTYLDDFLRSVRIKTLEMVCKPYKSVKLDFLAEKLKVTVSEIRSLLSELILEERMRGQIDQINGVLELNVAEQQCGHRHSAMQTWGTTLVEL